VREGFHYDVLVKTRDNTLAISPLAITRRVRVRLGFT